ncbi:MAG TPA: non-canonical purine NTP pyrophosphatase [Candidatus Saccharimonadales bacterium]
MSTLYFATSNAWKFQQGQAYLKQFGIDLKQANIELPESRSEDVAEIAREKAAFAYEQLKRPVIVIDGAFHIRALNDFPKTMVKFTEKYLGARGILKLLEDKTDRAYEWPNALCYKDATTEKFFVGHIRGKITNSIPDGSKANDFGLIQIPQGYDKPFSEMSKEELRHFTEHVWQAAIFRGFGEWMGKKRLINSP